MTSKEKIPLLKITNHKGGKLDGLNSINTSFANYCNKAQKTDSICKFCYQIKFQKLYPALKPALEYNTKLLIKPILPENIPYLNSHTIRFNSFGELHNKTHLLNLVNICKKNNFTNFTLWSKQIKLIENFFIDNKKPKNLIIIYSSPGINKPLKISNYKFADKIFTVFDKSQKEEKKINCKSKCKDCFLCYRPNKVKYINEILK